MKKIYLPLTFIILFSIACSSSQNNEGAATNIESSEAGISAIDSSSNVNQEVAESTPSSGIESDYVDPPTYTQNTDFNSSNSTHLNNDKEGPAPTSQEEISSSETVIDTATEKETPTVSSKETVDNSTTTIKTTSDTTTTTIITSDSPPPTTSTKSTARLDTLFTPPGLTESLSPSVLQTAVIQAPVTPSVVIPLKITEDAGVNRNNEPISQGIPLAPGMRDPSLFAVRDPQGNLLPTQVHPLGIHHPDGSLKWILLQFDASATASSNNTFQLLYGVRPPLPQKGLQISERTNEIEVNTGNMKFILPKRSSDPREDKKFLPSQVWVNDSGSYSDQDLVMNQSPQFNLLADWEHMTVDQYRASHRNALDLDSFGLGNKNGIWGSQITLNQNYSNIFSCPCKIDIEERGPVRAVFRISPEREIREGEMGYVARVYAYAGKKYYKVELNLENHDSYYPVSTYNDGSDRQYAAILNSKHIKNFTVSFNPLINSNSSMITFGTDNLGSVSATNGRLDQSSYKVATLNGRSVGNKSTGWMQNRDSRNSFTLAMQYFWEIYPKALESTDGRMTMHFWPSSSNKTTPIGAGRQRNYEFLVSFDAETPAVAQSAMMRNPLRGFPTPEYASESGIYTPTVSWNDTSFPKFKNFRQSSQARFLSRQLLYGDIHFGDQPAWNQIPLQDSEVRTDFGDSQQTTWNGYHGVSHDFFMDYFATGDSKNYRLAESVVRHQLYVDTLHNGYDAGGRNMIGGRNYDHMTNWVMGGQYMWVWGDVDWYLLSGKRSVYESLVRNTQFLMGFSGFGLRGFVPERTTSIPFMQMAYLYQAIGSERAIRQVFPQTPYSYAEDLNRNDSLSISQSSQILEVMKAATTYLNNSLSIWPYQRGQSHITISWFLPYTQDGCYGLWTLTQDLQAKRCVISSADYLDSHLSLPSGMPLYATDSAQRASSKFKPWADEVENIGTLAWLVSSDPKYLQYSWGPLDWRLNYAETASKMNGMNSAMGTALWILKKAGQNQNDISRLRSDINYTAAINKMMSDANPYINARDDWYQNSCMLALETTRVLINSNRKQDAFNWIRNWEDSWEHCNNTGNDSFALSKFKLKTQ